MLDPIITIVQFNNIFSVECPKAQRVPGSVKLKLQASVIYIFIYIFGICIYIYIVNPVHYYVLKLENCYISNLKDSPTVESEV